MERKKITLTPAYAPPTAPVTPPSPDISSILERLDYLIDKLDKVLAKIPPPPVEIKTYFYDEGTVSKTSTKVYRFSEEMGRPSRSGYIINDGDQDLKIKINDGLEITVKSGEERTWGPNQAIRITVDKLEIKTDSTTDQNYRVYAE